MVQDQVEYKKMWYLKNRERIILKSKKYALKNEEKIKEYKSEYCVGKTFKIASWKKNGLIGDYDEIWKRYCETEYCDMCNIKLTLERKMATTRKSMEHCHETGKFRNITCHKCNMKRKLKYKTKNNTGHKGIILVNDSGRIRWRYKTRRFKTKKDALCYKFICVMRNRRRSILS